MMNNENDGPASSTKSLTEPSEQTNVTHEESLAIANNKQCEMKMKLRPVKLLDLQRLQNIHDFLDCLDDDVDDSLVKICELYINFKHLDRELRAGRLELVEKESEGACAHESAPSLSQVQIEQEVPLRAKRVIAESRVSDTDRKLYLLEGLIGLLETEREKRS